MFLRILTALALSAVPLMALADDVDFERQIEPIFAAHCAKCHGAEKVQARLRLDTVVGIEEKLAAKPSLLIAGKPDDSDLYKRLVLPADNPKRMPKGADPLPQADIDLIGAWIQQGALFGTQTAVASTEASPTTKPAERPALPQMSAAPQEALDRLAAAGARVSPLYAGSNLLEVSFAGRAEPAGNADVALLAAVADQVYSLNLADAKITTAGLAPVAGLKNLTWLHLERSNVSDDGLAHLAKLPRLEYLNVYGTPITDKGLPHLAGLKHLTRLYLWQTKVSYEPAMTLERDVPGLVVNLGFDHPEVAKRRLAKELELAKKQAETAKAEVAKAKERLAGAEKDAESSHARVTSLEEQLKALDASTADSTSATDNGS